MNIALRPPGYLPVQTFPKRASSPVPAPPGVTYAVGVPTDKFVRQARPEDLGKQKRSNWCWAATIQMLNNFHGIPVHQAAIVARTLGTLDDQPADLPMIMENLNGISINSQGRPAVVRADNTNVTDSTIVGDLSQDKPLLIALKGPSISHAYVLTGATAHNDQFGRPVLDSVILRDPWPESESRTEISANEFRERALFAARVDVKHF